MSEPEKKVELIPLQIIEEWAFDLAAMTARVLLRLAGTKLLESEITTVPPCSDDTTPCSFVRCNVGCRRYL